jgi:hypothetical protein
MAVSIQNPSKYEVLAVLRLLPAKGETAAESHRQLVYVYGKGVMNRQNVAKWCVGLKPEAVMFMIKQGVEGHPLSLMKSSKN